MTHFISHISALQLLIMRGTPLRQLSGLSKIAVPKPCRAMPQPGTSPHWKEIADLGVPEGVLTEKLHINVAERDDRCRSRMLDCHVWTGPDRGTYLRVDDAYCVQSPEACFAQMAADLSLPHLLELGFMLCGTYAQGSQDIPTRYNVPPLTTPQKLNNYLARLSQRNGLAKARVAAKLVTAGSGSPMESKIATIMALSSRRGGRGKPAELNKEIKLTDAARGLGYRTIRRPDFLWADCHVAMDYDSHEYHDTAEALAADEERRNELAAVGLKSIVARRQHFENPLAFEALMGQLYSATGWRTESTVKELPAKRYELFQELFGNKQWSPLDQR